MIVDSNKRMGVIINAQSNEKQEFVPAISANFYNNKYNHNNYVHILVSEFRRQVIQSAWAICYSKLNFMFSIYFRLIEPFTQKYVIYSKVTIILILREG